MKNMILYVSAGACLLFAFVLIVIGWHGHANVSLALPISATSFGFCGSSTGDFAFFGICAVILAIILFIWAAVRTIVAKFG